MSHLKEAKEANEASEKYFLDFTRFLMPTFHINKPTGALAAEQKKLYRSIKIDDFTKNAYFSEIPVNTPANVISFFKLLNPEEKTHIYVLDYIYFEFLIATFIFFLEQIEWDLRAKSELKGLEALADYDNFFRWLHNFSKLEESKKNLFAQYIKRSFLQISSTKRTEWHLWSEQFSHIPGY